MRVLAPRASKKRTWVKQMEAIVTTFSFGWSSAGHRFERIWASSTLWGTSTWSQGSLVTDFAAGLISLLDPQPSECGLAVGSHCDFSRESALAHSLLVFVSFAFLKIVGFDAKLE